MSTIRISQFVTPVALVWILGASLFLSWALPDAALRFGMLAFVSGFVLVALGRHWTSSEDEFLEVDLKDEGIDSGPKSDEPRQSIDPLTEAQVAQKVQAF